MVSLGSNKNKIHNNMGRYYYNLRESSKEAPSNTGSNYLFINFVILNSENKELYRNYTSNWPLKWELWKLKLKQIFY